MTKFEQKSFTVTSACVRFDCKWRGIKCKDCAGNILYEKKEEKTTNKDSKKGLDNKSKN